MNRKIVKKEIVYDLNFKVYFYIVFDLMLVVKGDGSKLDLDWEFMFVFLVVWYKDFCFRYVVIFFRFFILGLVIFVSVMFLFEVFWIWMGGLFIVVGFDFFLKLVFVEGGLGFSKLCIFFFKIWRIYGKDYCISWWCG